MALKVIVNGPAPVLVYLVLRQPVGSDAVALAIAGAIPLALTTAIWVWRRRVERVGLLAVSGFGLALGVTAISGGSMLPLELRRTAVTGVIGAACIISVLARQPLWRPALRLLARLKPERATLVERIVRRADSEPAFARRLAIATLLVGITVVAEAAAQGVLALSVSTSTFLVIRLAIGCAGAAVAFSYVRFRRAR